MQFHVAALALLVGASMAGTIPPFSKRAGGPIAKPIPSDCSIDDSASPECIDGCNDPNNDNYKPSDSTMSSIGGYVYYLPMGEYQETSKTPDQLFQQCLETCYGYGNPGDCVAVYNSFNVPYGGGLNYVCQLFSGYLDEDDFVAVEDTTTYNGSRYGNIYCPPSN